MLLFKRKIFYCFSLLCLLSFYGCAFITMPVVPSIQPFKEEIISGIGDDKILVIDISGVISEKDKSAAFGLSTSPNMVSRIKEELNMASNDSDIKAVILKINTPGGTVTASDIIYNELKSFKNRTGVKVIALMMGMATSGGYYVAASADKIVAHPTTITGSIGVIAFKLKVYELMKKIGLTNDTTKSGAKKDIMSPFRPSTPEENEIIQEVIDTLHEQFVSVVASNRKELTLEEVKKIADGRIYTAKKALELKLIDKIGYLEDAVSVVLLETGIKNARMIRYIRPFSYKDNFYSKFDSPGLNFKNFNVINFDFDSVLSHSSPEFMYLWAQ